MEDINDIYGPYEIYLPWWFVIFISISVLIFVTLIAGGIYYLRKNKKSHPTKIDSKQNHFSPEDQLHITILKLKKDLQIHFADDISKKLAQAVRIFLRDAGHTDSLKKTTNETKRALKKSSLDPERQELIWNILRNADVVKFADRDTTRDKVTELISQALRYF